jgi:D-methionine transport system ATP-binding protein
LRALEKTMITVENLSKSFRGQTGPVVALDDVTLDVAAGTIAGVVGPSGSGKSTLARLLALQDRPDSGVIRLDGQNVAGLDPRRLRSARSRIGVVPSGDSLLKQRTAAGNIAIPLEQAGVDGPQRRTKVGQLLDVIGLTDKAATYPDQLTDGQRRRVAVARALVGEPTVLLADEPTAALDPDGAAGVLAVLDRARAELGATVLVATSDTGVLRKIADSAAILEHGRILEQGGLLQLVGDPDSLIAKALLPEIAPTAPSARHDRITDVTLIGFAAVGALLPEAGSRFAVDIAVLGGGLTRIGETPVAHFRLGVTGERADAAIGWIGQRGGLVRPLRTAPRGVAA